MDRRIRNFLLGLVVIVPLMFVTSEKVFGLLEFPTISTACEDRSGNLYAFNDGFSLKNTCEGKTRRVILIGEKGDKGDPGVQGIQGIQGTQGEKGEKGDPGSGGSGKVLKTFNNDNIELGLYVSNTEFFYPKLQRFVIIQPDGKLGYTNGGIYFSEIDCNGTTYTYTSLSDYRYPFNSYLYRSYSGKFYIYEGNPTLENISYQSYSSGSSCSNSIGSRSAYKLNEVTLDISDTVQFPLNFRYE